MSDLITSTFGKWRYIPGVQVVSGIGKMGASIVGGCFSKIVDKKIHKVSQEILVSYGYNTSQSCLDGKRLKRNVSLFAEGFLEFIPIFGTLFAIYVDYSHEKKKRDRAIARLFTRDNGTKLDQAQRHVTDGNSIGERLQFYSFDRYKSTNIQESIGLHSPYSGDYSDTNSQGEPFTTSYTMYKSTTFPNDYVFIIGVGKQSMIIRIPMVES